MRIKRVLQGTVLTALAAATLVGVDASAAATPKPTDPPASGGDETPFSGTVTFEQNEDTGAYQISVDAGSAKEVIVGFATYNKKGTVKIADTAWDVYDGGEAVIDLSKVNNTKDTYIAIKSDSTTPVYYKIVGNASGQKVKYDASTSKFTIENIKPAEITTANADFEYRTPYSVWSDFAKDGSEQLKNLQPQGATVYVRAAGGTITADDAEVTDAADSTKKYTLKTLGKLPGKESKVNIAKMANGPKITADYLKTTVTIPAGTEYRLTNDLSAVTANSGKAVKYASELLGSEKALALEVRKAAVAGKKAPSKWSRLDLVELKEFDTTLQATDNIADADADGTKDITVDLGGGVIAGYKLKSDKKSYEQYITISSANSDINVIVGNAEPKADDKAITVKKGAAKPTTIKQTSGTVYIRTVGDKKAKIWSGKYTAAGKIQIPTVPETSEEESK